VTVALDLDVLLGDGTITLMSRDVVIPAVSVALFAVAWGLSEIAGAALRRESVRWQAAAAIILGVVTCLGVVFTGGGPVLADVGKGPSVPQFPLAERDSEVDRERNLVKRGMTLEDSLVAIAVRTSDVDSILLTAPLPDSIRGVVVRRLSVASDSMARAYLARYRGAPASLLDRLSSDSSVLVREAVAANPHALAATLRALAHDPSSDVRSALVDNESVPIDVVIFLTTDRVPAIAASASRRRVHLVLGPVAPGRRHASRSHE
jgi:hypothetical protein